MIRVKKTSNHNHLGGRTSTMLETMSLQQIHNEAMNLMAQGISRTAWHALDLLYAGGIMTVGQLGLTTRTLRRYAKKRIVVLGKSDFLDGSPQSKVFEGRFVGERQRSGALGPNACHGDCRVERDFCSRTCGDDLCKRNCAYGFASCVRVCG